MKNYLSTNIKFLREDRGKTQLEVANYTGIGATTLGNWEKGRNEPNVSEALLIAQFFELSLNELIFSDLSNKDLNKKTEGKQNKDLNRDLNRDLIAQKHENTPVAENHKQLYELRPNVITVDADGKDVIPFVPLRAAAGYLSGYKDPTFIESLPSYRLPGFTNGIFRMFPTGGVSMHPTLNDSDILITQFVDSLHDIRDDRIHVIITKDDGILVKRVLNRIPKDNKLILKSDNIKDRQDYPNIVLEPENVLEVWYVVSYISRQMRAPGEMYAKMNDMEARLTMVEQSLKKSQH